MPYHSKIEAIIADVKSRGLAAEPYRPAMEIAMQSPSLLAEFWCDACKVSGVMTQWT